MWTVLLLHEQMCNGFYSFYINYILNFMVGCAGDGIVSLFTLCEHEEASMQFL